jgi:hypothetical protein
LQFSATVNVTDAVPPCAAPEIALCQVIMLLPLSSQVSPPVDVPVDVPVVVPVDVPVEVPVVVPVEVVPEVLVVWMHGPWLRLNWPPHSELISAVALVTVDPRFKVVT